MYLRVLGAEGLCCFAFVIAWHTDLKLIELITDKIVSSFSVGGIQLLISEFPQLHVISRSVLAGLHSHRKRVGRGSPSGELGDSVSLSCSSFKGLSWGDGCQAGVNSVCVGGDSDGLRAR